MYMNAVVFSCMWTKYAVSTSIESFGVCVG